MLIRSVLFNFQGAFLNSVAVISFRRLCYYITSFRVCQEVFKTFFKVFCDLFAFVVPSSRVLVYYITFIDKSQHFFEKFFSFVTYALYNQLFINIRQQNAQQNLIFYTALTYQLAFIHKQLILFYLF